MSEYEFNETENQQFLVFLQRLVVLSISLLFSGVIMVIQGIIPSTDIGSSIVGVVFIAISLALFLPIRYFLNIIITSGNDMSEVMKGFSMISFGLWFVIGASGLLLLSIIVNFIQSVF
ncbi:MAG: hypothetical protein ACXAD7_02240 [Candidatus Kariarchaeaceae archaeon]|jgi:hypothetical protein